MKPLAQPSIVNRTEYQARSYSVDRIRKVIEHIDGTWTWTVICLCCNSVRLLVLHLSTYFTNSKHNCGITVVLLFFSLQFAYAAELEIAKNVGVPTLGKEKVMEQEPHFKQLDKANLIGISLEMSRANDQTPQLWRSFMPRRQSISNRTSQNFMSMQVFPNGPKQVADPSASFTKWAVVQVESFNVVPDGMETYVLHGGLYAVFQHNGPATDLSTVMYIFQEWLPSSNYVLDDREHFEVLPVDYKPLDLKAHEEFWIPVKHK